MHIPCSARRMRIPTTWSREGLLLFQPFSRQQLIFKDQWQNMVKKKLMKIHNLTFYENIFSKATLGGGQPVHPQQLKEKPFSSTWPRWSLERHMRHVSESGLAFCEQWTRGAHGLLRQALHSQKNQEIRSWKAYWIFHLFVHTKRPISSSRVPNSSNLKTFFIENGWKWKTLSLIEPRTGPSERAAVSNKTRESWWKNI